MSLTAMAPTTHRPEHPADVEALAFCPTGLLVGGAFVPAAGGRVLDVEDPATGRTVAGVADAAPARLQGGPRVGRGPRRARGRPPRRA